MCGLVGYQSKADPSVADLTEVAETLTHRGPDDSGRWQSEAGSTLLAHRRLSIIDIEGGSQPMQRGECAIVYNGEIYNYRPLRESLAGAGYDFHTRSDTEVLLQGYRHWGLEVLDRVRGMFAFILWDGDEQRLVLARDPLGQKPLYYYHDQGEFLAASELQALLKHESIPRSCDPASLSWYLSLGYVPTPRTAFAKCKSIPPGNYLLVENGTIRDQVRYWDPVRLTRKRGEIRDSERINEEIRRRLSTAVERRLVSDVPLGAFLSGGIDSSLVVALMDRLSKRPVETVCVGFQDERYDERAEARAFAEHLGTRHSEFEVSVSMREVLPRLVRHFGQPFADSSAVPTYYVAQKAREVVKVVLSGDGGDEVFGGYRRYRALKLLVNLGRFLPGWGRRLIQKAGTTLGRASDRRSRWGEGLRVMRVLGASPVVQYLSMVGTGGDEFKRRLSKGPLERPASRGGEQWLGRWFRRFEHLGDPAQQSMAVDLMSYLPEDLLVKTDITTMMNSLECRSPFLDRDVVELGLRIPADRKIQGGRTKACLKSAFGELLPESVQKRKKRGFGVPLAEWFREGPHADFLEEILLAHHSGFFSLIDRYELEVLHEQHREGSLDAGPTLWGLVVMKSWMEEFDVRV